MKMKNAAKTTYKVVVNHEEQYSMWPDERDNPLAWKDASKSGPKGECLAYIKEVWTDMRPPSLRKKTAQGLPGQGTSGSPPVSVRPFFARLETRKKSLFVNIEDPKEKEAIRTGCFRPSGLISLPGIAIG